METIIEENITIDFEGLNRTMQYGNFFGGIVGLDG